LLDDDYRKTLVQTRFDADKRKKLYAEFAGVTSDTRKWSLLHPFDDLTGQQMTDVIDLCKVAKQSGLGQLDNKGRTLILAAGATEFFKGPLEAGK
jgi:hypothetical protein